jgi:hypothetical protein
VKNKIADCLDREETSDNVIVTSSDDLQTMLKNLWTIVRTSDREDVVMKVSYHNILSIMI